MTPRDVAADSRGDPEDMSLPPVPVLDIGGTHVTAALVDASTWRVVPGSETRLAVDSSGTAAALLGRWVEAAATVATAGAGWGVAMPGPFDYRLGIGRFAGVGKFDALNGVDVGAALRAGITPAPGSVAFVNDADAFLLGEWVNGAATGAGRCAAMTLGTGVGSAWLAGGEPVDSGPDVPRDGRAHHIVHDGVPLEDRMSRRAIRAAYAAATGDIRADVRDIADRARHGEPAAARVLDDALRFLGAALGPYVARFGAQVLVVGGSMSASWELFEPAFRKGYPGSPPPIVVARDREHAPLLGAALHAVRLR